MFSLSFYDVAQNPYFKTATNLLVYRSDRLCYEKKKNEKSERGKMYIDRLVMAFGFTLYCIVPLTVLFTGKLL